VTGYGDDAPEQGGAIAARNFEMTSCIMAAADHHSVA
jgi:hypothetical protein